MSPWREARFCSLFCISGAQHSAWLSHGDCWWNGWMNEWTAPRLPTSGCVNGLAMRCFNLDGEDINSVLPLPPWQDRLLLEDRNGMAALSKPVDCLDRLGSLSVYWKKRKEERMKRERERKGREGGQKNCFRIYNSADLSLVRKMTFCAQIWILWSNSSNSTKSSGLFGSQRGKGLKLYIISEAFKWILEQACSTLNYWLDVILCAINIWLNYSWHLIAFHD